MTCLYRNKISTSACGRATGAVIEHSLKDSMERWASGMVWCVWCSPNGCVNWVGVQTGGRVSGGPHLCIRGPAAFVGEGIRASPAGT